MYRIIGMAANNIAVELLTSGRDAQDEMDEIEAFINEGYEVIITADIDEHDAELVVRDPI